MVVIGFIPAAQQDGWLKTGGNFRGSRRFCPQSMACAVSGTRYRIDLKRFTKTLISRSRYFSVYLTGGALASVRRREAAADVLRLFHLVEDGDGKVLAADQAYALVVFDQLVEAEAELPSPGAGLDRGCRRDRRPVEVGHLLDRLQRQRRGLGGRRLHALFGHVLEVGLAVLAQQAAGADHEEAALHAGLAHRLDYPCDIVLVPLHGDDDRIMPFQRLDRSGKVGGGGLPDGHAGARREFARIARDRGHRMAARQGFVEDPATDRARGADKNDIHDVILCSRSRIAASVSTGASCGTL